LNARGLRGARDCKGAHRVARVARNVQPGAGLRLGTPGFAFGSTRATAAENHVPYPMTEPEPACFELGERPGLRAGREIGRAVLEQRLIRTSGENLVRVGFP